MILTIDLAATEPVYRQIRTQIVHAVATGELSPGEQLPSVRTLAGALGVNMHTVNKAYAILQREGFLKIDRRRGAVIAIDIDKLRALSETKTELSIVLARAICKNVNRDELHALVDEIYDAWGV